MKIVIIAVLMACAVMARATPFDIGPEGKSFLRNYTFGQLDGIQMNGQTVSFDLNFNNNVHLFRTTYHGFNMFLTLQTNGTNNTDFISGDGFVLDSAGNQMCAPRTLGGARTNTGLIFADMFPLYLDDGTLASDIGRPLDFHGVHFDLTLPDTGLFVTDGTFNLFTLETVNRNHASPFYVGVFVPDTGSTVLLFGVGIIALWLGRFDRTTKQAVEKGN